MRSLHRLRKKSFRHFVILSEEKNDKINYFLRSLFSQFITQGREIRAITQTSGR